MNKKNPKLENLLKKYEKGYTVQKGSEIVVEPKIRTKIFGFDYVLDGGISQQVGGHKIEIYGEESSGKTAIALMTIGQYQKLGKVCAFINAENSYDPEWAQILGVKNEDLLVVTPDTLENAGNLLIEMVADVDLIVIDSIIALVPEAEVGRDLADKTMASQASVNAPMCRKLNRKIAKYKTTIIFINQLREKVGQRYGNPETTSGGRALRHFYDTRIRFKQGKPIDVGSGDKKERIGFEIDVWTKKNKKGKPYKRAVMDFYFTGELDNKKSLLFSAVKYGIIERAGAWYTYGEIREQGQEKLVVKLTEKDWDTIECEIWSRIK